MSASRRRTRELLAVALAVVAAVLLAACGNDSSDAKLLSRSSASELRSTLAEVEGRVQAGDCDGAQEWISLLDQQIDSLGNVDGDLRDALASGAGRLEQLVTEKCEAPVTETGTTGATGPAGTTDTGGATGPEEETDKPGKSEGKGKGKKNGQNKDEPPVETVPDTGTGGAGDGGTTDSGGVVP
jgi:hypothetical protein